MFSIVNFNYHTCRKSSFFERHFKYKCTDAHAKGSTPSPRAWDFTFFAKIAAQLVRARSLKKIVLLVLDASDQARRWG